MKRILRMALLQPDKVGKYRKIHANAPQAVRTALNAANIHNYSIAEKDGALISYFEYTGTDYENDLHTLGEMEVVTLWNEELKDCFRTDSKGNIWSDFEEAFYLG